ncbi:MAG: DNA polymerase III subunit delta [Treponematales bacterium]
MAKGNCWLFLGPEIGEKEDAINEIRRKLGVPVRNGAGAMAAGNGGPAPDAPAPAAEETVFYAGETPAREIAGSLQSGSLFSGAQLFIIKNIEAVNAKKKDDLELLAGCLESPQDGAAIILVSEETSVSKTIEKAVPPANKRVFWELDDSRKAEWVAAFFRRAGFRVTPDGVETVLELVENNTDALRRECGSLTFFLDKERPVDAAAVEKWLSHTRAESAFTLFSRVARGDLERSLESVRTLLGAKESPQSILAGLAWCFRKLRDYLALRDSGTASDFEYRKIGLASPKVRRDYIEAGRRRASAEPALALIAASDIRLRSSGAVWETPLMDNLVRALCRAD